VPVAPQERLQSEQFGDSSHGRTSAGRSAASPARTPCRPPSGTERLRSSGTPSAGSLPARPVGHVPVADAHPARVRQLPAASRVSQRPRLPVLSSIGALLGRGQATRRQSCWAPAARRMGSHRSTPAGPRGPGGADSSPGRHSQTAAEPARLASARPRVSSLRGGDPQARRRGAAAELSRPRPGPRPAQPPDRSGRTTPGRRCGQTPGGAAPPAGSGWRARPSRPAWRPGRRHWRGPLW